jgi:hypothetical protein
MTNAISPEDVPERYLGADLWNHVMLAALQHSVPDSERDPAWPTFDQARRSVVAAVINGQALAVTTNPSETALRLADALVDRSRLCMQDAGSRARYGKKNATARAALREEARRCDVLRAAILAADPVDLDAVIDRK